MVGALTHGDKNDKTVSTLLALIVLAMVSSSGQATGPLHVYLKAIGNTSAGAGVRTMRMHGLCYQVNDNTLWTSGLEVNDVVSQSGGTVFFDVSVYTASDLIEFQVNPGSTFTCRGYTIQSDGTFNSFNITRKNARLGSIAETLVMKGPNYVQTKITINAQWN